MAYNPDSPDAEAACNPFSLKLWRLADSYPARGAPQLSSLSSPSSPSSSLCTASAVLKDHSVKTPRINPIPLALSLP